MRFKHFIITRFNVNIEPTDFPLRLEDTWLSLRFDLFQRFCFPSVRGQQNQDFTWMVLFDEQTPDTFKRIIALYEKYDNFVPIYCGQFQTIRPMILNYLKHNSQGSEWVVSTRLDNDDSLGNKFTGVLHSVVNGLIDDESTRSDKMFINFPNGLQYHNGEIYNFKDLTNAFVSLMEKTESIESVFCIGHPSIHKKAPVVQVDGQPLWLQTVHETNVYNYIRGELVESGDPLKSFSIKL
ncbi:MAG: putative rhamnosyl transferase [Proteobacteria bacterium]|nr:putative rhamnosyl transferase [Pseudomonadota bacterium]